MTDSYDEVETQGPDEPGTGERAGFEPTGNPVVDSVLQSLERLDGAPVSEHVRVFESAHERLRGALADAGNEQAEPDGSRGQSSS